MSFLYPLPGCAFLKSRSAADRAGWNSRCTWCCFNFCCPTICCYYSLFREPNHPSLGVGTFLDSACGPLFCPSPCTVTLYMTNVLHFPQHHYLSPHRRKYMYNAGRTLRLSSLVFRKSGRTRGGPVFRALPLPHRFVSRRAPCHPRAPHRA